MLQQFAITPDVFHPKMIAQYPKMETAIGFILASISKHGMLANLHQGEWYRFIKKQLIPHLSPEIRRDVLDYLALLDSQDRLVLQPAYNKQGALDINDWFYAAEEQHESTKFHGIIVSPFLFAKHTFALTPVIDATKAYQSSAWKTQSTCLKIKTEAPDYREHLAPLLRYARTVQLIDPYFDCQESSNFELLNICCQLIRNPQKSAHRAYFHIHTSDTNLSRCSSSERPYFVQNCKERWRHRLDELVKRYKPNQYEFTVFWWRDFRWEDKQHFHDRYILSNQGGIAVQYGLRLEKGNATVWNLLDHETKLSIQADFTNSGTYEPLAQFTTPEPTD